MNLKIAMLSSLCLLFKDVSVVDYANNLETSVNFQARKKDVTELHEGQYSITVTSNYIYRNEDDRPIAFSQKITLRYNDSVIYDSLHKSRIEKNMINCKSLKYMENQIIEVGIMKGQTESLFLVQGYGGCMDCTSFFEIFNKEGKSIYIEYSDKFKVYLRRGNYNVIHGKYGISIQKLRKRIYTKKETFPEADPKRGTHL